MTLESLRGFSPITYTSTAGIPALAVNVVDVTVGQILHMWTIIDPNLTESPKEATTYKVYAGNYGDIVFDHWSDGSKERIRELTIGESTTITASYVH